MGKAPNKSVLSPYMKNRALEIFYKGGDNTIPKIASILKVNEHAVRRVVDNELKTKKNDKRFRN